MLVLSRGVNDKVVFPTLGITVDIVRIDGSKVRLGIDAPREIPVHRHEIADKIEKSGESMLPNGGISRELTHAIRNRLNTAALGLHMLHKKLELGQADDAETDIFTIFNELKAIEDQIEGKSRAPQLRVAPESHRALVVEDDANERELLSGYLEMSGFEVDSAMDGMQAMVKLTDEQRPDVVLLDMKMPRFDGRKTVSAIRNNDDYRDLKVFAVSGEKPATMNVPVGENGVDRWFSKPINPQELVTAIREELTSEFVSA